MKKLLMTSVLSLAVVLSVNAADKKQKFVTIGTGSQTGVYFVVGQSICKLVNRNIKKHGIKCNAPSTGASIANLNAIVAGEQDMGIAQSDSQYEAYNGVGKFEGKQIKKLRSVFSVHPELFTVIARKDSGIKKFSDIKGKKVNIGDPGSGTRTTMELTMKAKGIAKKDLALASELKPAEMSAALCDKNIDAITYVVGHPSGAIKEATTSCDAVVVDVSGKEIDELVAKHSYYAKLPVPGGMYKGSDKDTNTYGMLTTFVSSTDTDAETVYEVVKAVFDNFNRFKKLHPAFANLKEEEMIKNGLSAPLHEGAIKYYKERGWIK